MPSGPLSYQKFRETGLWFDCWFGFRASSSLHRRASYSFLVGKLSLNWQTLWQAEGDWKIWCKESAWWMDQVTKLQMCNLQQPELLYARQQVFLLGGRGWGLGMFKKKKNSSEQLGVELLIKQTKGCLGWRFQLLVTNFCENYFRKFSFSPISLSKRFRYFILMIHGDHDPSATL